jgi:hypothetical protein
MDKGVKMSTIKETTLHPENQPDVDLYPKTSSDQVEGLNNIISGINNEIEKKVNTVDNFVRVFTIPNGVSSGTLTADVKEKLCNPDGHNYYVYDDTSEIILKYSFNSDNEIIQYKAVYLQFNRAYEITMQIFPSNGSWRRSQTVLNVPASAGGKLYLHSMSFSGDSSSLGTFYGYLITTDSETSVEFTIESLKEYLTRLYHSEMIVYKDFQSSGGTSVGVFYNGSVYNMSGVDFEGTTTSPQIVPVTSFTDTITEL